MQLVKIHYTSSFVKNFKNLSPEKQKIAIVQEGKFRKDPFSPSLKTHKLTGKLKECWAFSITYNDRVVFQFISKQEAIFYKIGSHQIYR